MKKTKLIALTMVVAIMLMGAGYAIWSDQVFLLTTIRTGNFDMKITEATVRTGHRENDSNEAHDWHEFDWTNKGEVRFTDNQATVELIDLYPGGVVQVNMTTTNEGTIPAKLKKIDVEFVDGNQDLFNRLKAKPSWKADIDGDKTKDTYNHMDNTDWEKIQKALNLLVADLNDKNIVIEPGGWLELGRDDENGCIKFKLDENAGNEFQNKSVKFKITFIWEQWSTDPVTNPYDGQNGYGGDGDQPGIYTPSTPEE